MTATVKASYAGFTITRALCRVAWQRALWRHPYEPGIPRKCPTCRKRTLSEWFRATFDGGRMGHCRACRSFIAEYIKGYTSLSRINERATEAGEILRGEV